MSSATLNLLKVDKLTGENYTTWKNSIVTILIINDLRFVLLRNILKYLLKMHPEMFGKANEKA